MHRSGLSAKPASVGYMVSLCEVYRMREAGDGGRRGTEGGRRREGKEAVRRRSVVASEPRSGVLAQRGQLPTDIQVRRTTRPNSQAGRRRASVPRPPGPAHLHHLCKSTPSRTLNNTDRRLPIFSPISSELINL